MVLDSHPIKIFIKNFIFKFVEKILSINTNTIITINNEDYKYAESNLLRKKSVYKLMELD